MRSKFKRIVIFGKENPTSQAEQELLNTCAGRMASVMTYFVLIVCLGVWITFFLLIKDYLSAQPLSNNVINNLTCIMFFGGLVLAFFVGAMIGNFVRRAFWKWLVRRSIK
jgi:fumarate reductase subunit D